MIHASIELIGAIHGGRPESEVYGSLAACGSGDSSSLAWHWLCSFEGGEFRAAPCPRSVDCPDCIKLMVLAQGDRADVLQLREYEAGQARVEAEMERERVGGEA